MKPNSITTRENYKETPLHRAFKANEAVFTKKDVSLPVIARIEAVETDPDGRGAKPHIAISINLPKRNHDAYMFAVGEGRSRIVVGDDECPAADLEGILKKILENEEAQFMDLINAGKLARGMSEELSKKFGGAGKPQYVVTQNSERQNVASVIFYVDLLEKNQGIENLPELSAVKDAIASAYSETIKTQHALGIYQGSERHRGPRGGVPTGMPFGL